MFSLLIMLHLFTFPQPGWRQISRRRKISSHNQSSEGALEAKVTWSILPPKACIHGDHLPSFVAMPSDEGPHASGNTAQSGQLWQWKHSPWGWLWRTFLLSPPDSLSTLWNYIDQFTSISHGRVLQCWYESPPNNHISGPLSTWSYYLIIIPLKACLRTEHTNSGIVLTLFFFFYRSGRLEPKKLSKTSWKSQVRQTAHVICLGHNLD